MNINGIISVAGFVCLILAVCCSAVLFGMTRKNWHTYTSSQKASLYLVPFLMFIKPRMPDLKQQKYAQQTQFQLALFLLLGAAGMIVGKYYPISIS